MKETMMNHNTTKIDGAAEQYKATKLAKKLQDEYLSIARAYTDGTEIWVCMETDSNMDPNPMTPVVTADMFAEGYVIDYCLFGKTYTFVPVEEMSE